MLDDCACSLGFLDFAETQTCDEPKRRFQIKRVLGKPVGPCLVMTIKGSNVVTDFDKGLKNNCPGSLPLAEEGR